MRAFFGSVGRAVGITVVGAVLTCGGCTQLEVERTLPDGSRQRYRFLEFKPAVEITPARFRIVPHGRTQQGYPIERIVPIDGGGPPIYRVVPPVGAPIYFEPDPSAAGPKPAIRWRMDAAPDADAPIAMSPESGIRLRLQADVELDEARLERSDDGQTWMTVASGRVGPVAKSAAEHGIRSLSIESEEGQWTVDADPVFPLATVRLEGQIVMVRPLG